MLDHKRCTFVGGTVIGYKAVIFGYSVLHTAEPDWMNYLPGSLPVQHSTAYVD